MTGAKTSNERLISILAVVVNYDGVKAAAHELDLSEHTVNGYLHQLYSRLGVTGQTAALRRLGWLRVPHGVELSLARRVYERAD